MTEKESLFGGIRSSFRDEANDEAARKERMHRAMKGLRLLYSLDTDNLPSLTARSASSANPLPSASTVPMTTAAPPSSSVSIENEATVVSSQDWLNSVEWLPHISEMKDTEVDSSHIPVFPLSGPVFADTRSSNQAQVASENDAEVPRESILPLFSQFSDVPVAGMEIPLQIFEPLYRQMYQDLLSSAHSSGGGPVVPPAKRFIVPFAHPHRAGQFAAFGWLYEIVRVQDVADETNGKLQLVCHHIVSKPVKIHSIVNPTDFHTKFTYLRASAEIVEDVDDARGGNTRRDGSDLQPLEDLLRHLHHEAKAPSPGRSKVGESDKLLIDRLLTALGEGSIWSAVHVWVSNLQMEILQLQVQIARKIQLQAQGATSTEREDRASPTDDRRTSDNGTSTPGNDQQQVRGVVMTDDMILLAQRPHKEELESMLLEVSTLVPLLLQDGSQQAQCQRMCQRIRERYYGVGTRV